LPDFNLRSDISPFDVNEEDGDGGGYLLTKGRRDGLPSYCVISLGPPASFEDFPGRNLEEERE